MSDYTVNALIIHDFSDLKSIYCDDSGQWWCMNQGTAGPRGDIKIIVLPEDLENFRGFCQHQIGSLRDPSVFPPNQDRGD